MHTSSLIRLVPLALALLAPLAFADEVAEKADGADKAVASAANEQSPSARVRIMERASALVSQANADAQNLLDGALGLVGIRYRRGGESAESGFDCSGFVGYVFLDRLGLKLPRTSREISRVGENVEKTELEPGDLVFFKTMRRTFSHVGIYIGDHLFVHAPKPGQKVRVEDMRQTYWAKRYNGARRVESTDASE